MVCTLEILAQRKRDENWIPMKLYVMFGTGMVWQTPRQRHLTATGRELSINPAASASDTAEQNNCQALLKARFQMHRKWLQD